MRRLSILWIGLGLWAAAIGCGSDELTTEGMQVCDRVCAVYETCSGVGQICMTGCYSDYRGASDECIAAGQAYATCLESNVCGDLGTVCEPACLQVSAECGVSGSNC